MEIHVISGIKFMASPNILPVPRFQVSPEFARIQHPDLVAKTNAWMERRFGTYYPVYAIDPSAFELSMYGGDVRSGSRQKVISVHISEWPRIKSALLAKGGA